MSINSYLKKIGITKTKLAKELELSRPTLNQYIELFENNQKIENERYNIIFNRLFEDTDAPADIFAKKLQGIKNLLDRDMKYGIARLEPKAADLVSKIHNLMIKDMENDTWNSKVYDAILILLNNYRKNELMRELACYFSDLNAGADETQFSYVDKAYYSYYFKIFSVIASEKPDFDDAAYEEFLDRMNDIKIERKRRQEERVSTIRERMQEKLLEVEAEFHDNDIEASEQDILAEVMRRLKREDYEREN